jgi:hypothetical protein
MRVGFLGVIALAALLIACGDGPSAPDACRIEPVFWSGWSWEGSAGSASARLTTPTWGVIRASADWDTAANNVDLYLTDASCRLIPPIAPGPPPCHTIYASADGRTTKPEVLEACVDAGEYWIMVVDRGPYHNRGDIRVEAPPGTPQ